MPEGLGSTSSSDHDETGGEYVEMEWTLPPGGSRPRCIATKPGGGVRDARGHDRWRLRTLTVGESASIPVNTDHTVRIPAGQSVRVGNVHRPGGRFDEFVAKEHRFAASDRFEGLKRPSTAIVMAMAWPGTTRPTGSKQIAPCLEHGGPRPPRPATRLPHRIEREDAPATAAARNATRRESIRNCVRT